MRAYYCNGKKGLCNYDITDCATCNTFNGNGGEYVEVPERATKLWIFLFCLKKRLKGVWSKIHGR